MTGGDGKKQPDKKLELQIFDRFSKIARQKVTAALSDESKVKQLDSLYSHPEFNEERKILTEMNSLGLTNGILSGLACFAFLRWSPGAISRYLMRRRAAISGFGSKTPDVANPFNRSSGYQLEPPPGDHGNATAPNFVIRGLRLGLDIFVSMSIGAYASILFIDKDRLMKQFSEIPLVQGRSIISEELCSDFSEEFRKYKRDTWDKNHPALSGGLGKGNEKSDFISVVEGFVANCKRRSIYEKDIRTEQGLRENEPVVIPPPGVPRDIPVTLDDLMGNKIEGDSDNSDMDDFYFDKYFDEEGGEENTKSE
ncbi:hypothetical protein HJC23_001198 [Cyclotella cryptica]|uniref:Transmembrane protein 242 n=1 Tax=Cyclotella cryptica TaxID=29204 RepID=A0ABD3QNW3_9STRA|eukprot:CCRYP_003857-RA/>CCRYP_003857-RA protein AED:0.04 eAED:0.04 QI:119/-1/1/1/-1/1/1/1128/309